MLPHTIASDKSLAPGAAGGSSRKRDFPGTTQDDFRIIRDDKIVTRALTTRSFRNHCLPRLEVRLILTDPANKIDHFSLYDIRPIDMNKMAAVPNNDATTAG